MKNVISVGSTGRSIENFRPHSERGQSIPRRSQIIEMDESNVNYARRLASMSEVRHYQSIPVYLCLIDDHTVIMDLNPLPVNPDEESALVSNYKLTAQHNASGFHSNSKSCEKLWDWAVFGTS